MALGPWTTTHKRWAFDRFWKLLSQVRIHRVLTGECVHRCRTPTVAPLGGDFPHFLWSHDGKYFAECNESAISVRETASFELIKDEAINVFRVSILLNSP